MKVSLKASVTTLKREERVCEYEDRSFEYNKLEEK